MSPDAEKYIDSLISGLDQVEPPARLLDTVLVRIEGERRRSARRRLVLSACLGLASLSALFPAVSYLVRDLAGSVFGRYLALLVSDGSYLVSFWSEYLMSLAESLPLTSLAGVLAAVLTLLASLKLSAKYLSQLQTGIAPA